MQSSPELRQAGSSTVTIAPTLLGSLVADGIFVRTRYVYVTWQQGQATTDDWISQFAKAGDVLLKQGFRLNLSY
jgi:hypothetical protein